MAKQINRLSARKVATESAPGMHADGAGLYLRVSRGQHSGKRWVFVYRRPRDSKRCELGLGSAVTVTLAEARKRAADARACLTEGTDPRASKLKAKTCATFGEVADRHVATMEPRWRNDKHKAQWRMTLQVYAGPLRDLDVDQITTDDVLCVLKPIWQSRPETASRVRGRIEAVLDAATAQGLRTGANPATWKGNLQFILPPAKKLTRGHHRAMPIDDLPEFMSQLRSRPAIAARCLEFTILTASRTGEALGARWEEIDLNRAVWTLPANRMRKSGREHCVPLSGRAIEILNVMDALKIDSANGGYAFPGQRRSQPLSNMALLSLLKRMKIAVTVHGFRSTFRDWAGDRTEFARELVELALSHQVGNYVERAYRRNDALVRRRPLMEDWAVFCASTSGEIDGNRRKTIKQA